MRIVTYGGAVSLDGFLADAAGGVDWLHFSKDVQQEMAEFWKDVDTILMGRKTYGVAAGSELDTSEVEAALNANASDDKDNRDGKGGKKANAARRRSRRCAPMSFHVP